MVISEDLSAYISVRCAHCIPSCMAVICAPCDVLGSRCICIMLLHARTFCIYTFTRLEPLQIRMGRHLLVPGVEFLHLNSVFSLSRLE